MTWQRAVEVVYGTKDIYDSLQYVLVAGGTLVGGIFIWHLLFWLIEYVSLGTERSTLYFLTWRDKQQQTYYEPATQRPMNNFLHLVLRCVYFAGVVLIIWIACGAAGFNVWTTAAAMMSFSIILTYAFATPLGLLGSGLAVLATNTIAVGQYWEFFSMPEYDGIILAIYGMEVTIGRHNVKADAGEIISIPISTFLSTPRKRVLKMELFHSTEAWRTHQKKQRQQQQQQPNQTKQWTQPAPRPAALPFLPAPANTKMHAF